MVLIMRGRRTLFSLNGRGRAMFYEAGLVLEGGGMRGLYTAGILDFFMEKGIMFEDIYGVSAGACHLCSYLSNQPGRAFRVSTEYLKDKYYCSAYSLIKTGDLFNVDMCYDKIPNELDPFDYEAFSKCKGTGHVVVTDIVTGKPRYIRLREMRRDIVAVQASASLPLVSRTVKIGGREYLDGGMADSIPIKKSMHDGHDKNVIVLTRPLGYEKKPTSSMSLIKFIYRNYPGLVEDMKKRHIRYNRTLEYIEKLEAEGKVFVFRPESIIKIDRIEKDEKKLKVLYLQGYHDAAINYKLMKEYLES